MRDVPYPADYDEAMRRFMATPLREGAANAWLATRAALENQGLDAASVRRAEEDLIALRATSELFLSRLISVGGLSADDVVDLGADLATTARVAGALTARGGVDIADGDVSVSIADGLSSR